MTDDQATDARTSASLSGGCLCGAVRYRADGAPLESSHCHCTRCRRQHGAAFATYGAWDRAAVTIEGASELTRFRPEGQVTRSFCQRCGSSLLWEHDALPDIMWIALATLDDHAAIRVDVHIWAGFRVPWCVVDDELPRHAEGWPVPELLALMAARRRRG